MDDVAGTTGYEYDEVGRITIVNLSNGKKIKYSYDEYGNISKLTYPDNTTVQYTYDELDQLTQIKDRQGKITKYERDANGNVTKVTRPNNTYSTIEYDDMGNVIKVTNMGKEPYFGTAKTLSTFAYTYDKSGFITSEAAAVDKQVVTNLYEYDERAQLVKDSQTITVNGSVTESTQTVYTYDNAGNRLTTVKTSDDSVICNIQYTYNDNNQVTDIEGNCDDDNKYKHVVLSYDKNGNLTRTQCNETEKVMDYTYDNENRLKAVKENGTLLMAALYDGNGDRIFRLDYRKNSEYVSNKAGTAENVYYPASSVNSAYDTDVILNEMLIPNGVTNNTAINYELTGYINDINTEYTQTLMEFGANGSTTNVYEYGDGRNSAAINGTKGYYLYDGRGSVSSLTGSSGSNIISYSYDAYGNTTKSNNTLNNPYQYNAEYTDSSTGLQYLRARYYDSSQGRFTTKDTVLGSIEKPITRNLYIYCGNNPLNNTDPSGHGWFKNAWNGVKRAATNVYNGAKRAVNTAVNWANTHIVQPVVSRITNSSAYQKGKQYVERKYQEAKQTYNKVSNYVGGKVQKFYNDYVPPKMQKAIEEAKKFVCTTSARIAKDTKEFIQNVDWKKVAIGVGATLAVTAVVVATGGAAAPVLIGAAVGAGISTGTTVVSGVIQGKSPAEIAQDASGAFMWGAIGGAVGGGTTSLLESAGSKITSTVGKKLVEDGVDMTLDLAQTASENGGLTGKDILFSAATTLGGGLLSSVKTPSTVRNQLVDGVTDNKAVKNAVGDSVTDNKAVKNAAENIKGPYSYLEDSASVADGKSFTAAQKKKIIEENMKKNGGVIKSDLSGEVLVPATKSTKGVTPNPSEVNIDHIFPKSAGGSNSYSNAQVLSRAENIAKSNKY